jgi:hypothetical protein
MSDDNEGIRGQRVRKNKGSEPIRREALQDERNSFKATGILGFLLSLPDNWTTNAERLGKTRKGKEGRTAILSGLRELEDNGYLIRKRVHLGGGKWEWIWRYSDDPSDLQQEDVSAGHPISRFPAGGPPAVGKPADKEVLDVEILEVDKDLEPSSDAGASHATVTDLFGGSTAGFPAGVQPPTNGHVSNRAGRRSSPPSEGDSRVTTAASPPDVSRRAPRAELDALHAGLFEEFWGTYAYKVGKGAARKAWTVACRKADPREVINAAARYARSRRGEDPRFTAHPGTWLNQERWLDEPEYVRNGQVVGGDRRGGGYVAYQNPPDDSGYYRR